jgi:hypothetical protein
LHDDAPRPPMPPNPKIDGRREVLLDECESDRAIRFLRYYDATLVFRNGVAIAMERNGELYTMQGTAPAALTIALPVLRQVFPHAEVVPLEKVADCLFLTSAFFGRTTFGDLRLRVLLRKAKHRRHVVGRRAVENTTNERVG